MAASAVLLALAAWAFYAWHARRLHAARGELEMLVDERTGQLVVEKERATVALRESEALHAAAEEANNRATAARETALQASAAKSSFVASITHEIRTPLNAIVGMTDALADTPLDGRQREYVAALKAAGRALSELINHTLDMSRIEVGRFDVQRAPFDLRALVEETAAMARIRAVQKGLTLETGIDRAIPPVVRGDAVALRRVLINLLGNAVKFTEHGGVTLRLMPAVAGAGAAPLLFSIDDTGIGIPPHKLDVVFDALAQADESIGRKFGGIGLGLSISRELVELMGGRIWARSQVGQGSTFSFTVPLPEEREAEQAALPLPAPARAGEPLRILLVEDSPLNRLVVTAHLEDTADTIDIAEDGEAAIDAVTQHRYDLVLMDVHMPGMTGYEAAETIREWEQQARRPRTPIVALTANAMSGDRERCLAAGMDDYLAKPFDLAELEARVRALTRRGMSGAPTLARHGALTYDQVGRIARLNDVRLELSARELSLLEIFLQRAGRLVSKDQLVSHLCEWGEEVSPNAIEVYVHRLRKKLEPGGVRIVTVRGLGYSLEKPAA